MREAAKVSRTGTEIVEVPELKAEPLKPLSERTADAKKARATAFETTDKMRAGIVNHAKEDSIILGIVYDESELDFSPWLIAKAAIRAAIPIPTE